jgi:HK97 gp10 family phage protein
MDKSERIVLDALRAAAVVFLRKARALAPVREGLLRSNVIMYRSVKADKNLIGYTIGVSRKAFYWRFMEKGFIPRGNANGKRDGNGATFSRGVRGRVVKRPFLQPAFESEQGRALAAFYRKLDEKTL